MLTNKSVIEKNTIDTRSLTSGHLVYKNDV